MRKEGHQREGFLSPWFTKPGGFKLPVIVPKPRSWHHKQGDREATLQKSYVGSWQNAIVTFEFDYRAATAMVVDQLALASD